MTLSNKKILIVGAATSIGQTVVDGFLARGATVLATINRQHPATLDQPGVTVVPLDLQDPGTMERLCRENLPAFGALDVVVFLSGLLPGKALSAYDDELMQDVMTVNFTGQAALLRRLLPHLAEGSVVLMVSSISGERGSFDPIYAAAKAAQIGLVKSLATWLAPKVRVNAIAPALIEGSTMFDAMQPERRAHHLKQTPSGRLTTKEDVAGVIHSLCEPAWSNVNGQVIRINGGAHV